LQHFEEDLKVYDLNMLVKEVEKIDELEAVVKEELAALEKRWKKLLRWSEERGLRLTKIVSLWSKFRLEEIAILNWIDEKGEQLKVADDVVNLADEANVTEQLDVLKVQFNAVASLGLFYTSSFGRVECNSDNR
jgi:hypothetical protein